MENIKVTDVVCLEDLQICNIHLDQEIGSICAVLKDHNNVILSTTLSTINTQIQNWLEYVIEQFPQLYNTVFQIDGQACHCVGIPFRTPEAVLVPVYDIDAAEFFNAHLEHVINAPECRKLETSDLERNWCFGDRYVEVTLIREALFPDED